MLFSFVVVVSFSFVVVVVVVVVVSFSPSFSPFFGSSIWILRGTPGEEGGVLGPEEGEEEGEEEKEEERKDFEENPKGFRGEGGEEGRAGEGEGDWMGEERGDGEGEVEAEEWTLLGEEEEKPKGVFLLGVVVGGEEGEGEERESCGGGGVVGGVWAVSVDFCSCCCFGCCSSPTRKKGSFLHNVSFFPNIEKEDRGGEAERMGEEGGEFN